MLKSDYDFIDWFSLRGPSLDFRAASTTMTRLYQLIKLKSDLSIVISIYFCSIYWPQWYLIQLLIFGVVFLVYVVIYLKICEERHSSSHTMIPSKLLLSTRCIPCLCVAILTKGVRFWHWSEQAQWSKNPIFISFG